MWLLEDWHPSAEERNFVSDDQNLSGKNFIFDFSLLQIVACDHISFIIIITITVTVYFR
jgi:hypothetical protein